MAGPATEGLLMPMPTAEVLHADSRAMCSRLPVTFCAHFLSSLLTTAIILDLVV